MRQGLAARRGAHRRQRFEIARHDCAAGERIHHHRRGALEVELGLQRPREGKCLGFAAGHEEFRECREVEAVRAVLKRRGDHHDDAGNRTSDLLCEGFGLDGSATHQLEDEQVVLGQCALGPQYVRNGSMHAVHP